MCLQVAWDDTIVVVKAMIQAKEYIARCKQVLKFNDITLEDSQTLLSYDIMPGSTLELGKLPGGGKRAAPGNEGGREDKDVKCTALRHEVLATLAMTQGTRHAATHTVRNRIMELERDSRELKNDQIFQRLYENMTEPQMLKMQERFVACGRNTNQRFIAVAKSIFEHEFREIEDCKRELGTMAKAMIDTTTLAMFIQYCGETGIFNWESFIKHMNEITTEKSRAVGARGD